jgi:hypothetical protein
MAQILIPPPRIPVLDSRTGMMAQAWYAFFAQFLQGASNDIVSLEDDVAGLFIDGAMNGPPLAALDEIRKRVADLETDYRPDPAAALDTLSKRIAELEADFRPDPAAALDALRKRIAELETELALMISPLAAIDELRKRVADIETDIEIGL